MVRIALIVTGDLELSALGRSLGRVFPNTEFIPQKVDCFTSAAVRWPPPARPGIRSDVERYAAAFLAALDPGRGHPKPDFVFGIEDLELANRHQPQEVIRVFREALTAELTIRQNAMNSAPYKRLQSVVKERCSFHLFAPMCEAYFFTDEAFLRAAGCTRAAILTPGRDVETFEVADEEYLAAGEKFAPWAIDPQLRRFHPKRYLEFLRRPDRYRETKDGVNGMLAIDWFVVLSRLPSPSFLRSLFQDLADALGTDVEGFAGREHPFTSARNNRDRIVRNL